MTLKTITNRVFLLSSAIAVAITLFCLAVINHFNYQQRFMDQERKLESLLDQQVPYLKSEYINSRFYAIRLRGQDLATRYEAAGVHVSLYDASGDTIFESGPTEGAKRTASLPDLVQVSRPLVFAGEMLGRVKLSAHVIPDSSSTLGRVLLFTLGILLCSFLVLFLACHHLLKNHVLKPIQQIAEAVPGIRHFIDRQSEILALPEMPKSTELASVVRELSGMSHELRDNLAKTRLIELAMERQTAVAELARQVAHDIRSPLAALNMVASDLAVLPEEQRLIIRSAINRIQDIATTLLDQNRGKNQCLTGQLPVEKAAKRKVVLLSSLIDEVVTEKRMQYRTRIGVSIESNLDSNFYGLFANVHETELKRVISNLINNSVEAMSDIGSVIVSIARQDTQVCIAIADNGKGIPTELIAHLGRKGETHGKIGGSGLGLFHARTQVESWGGCLTLSSTPGHGTTVKVTLPLANTPDWFVEQIRLSPTTQVVVVDDDTSIHQIWGGRAGSLPIDAEVQWFHFSTPRQIRDFVRTREVGTSTLYLFDYEFIGFSETGLSLIAELGLGGRSILVTSRYEEEELQQDCSRLGVKLIPKGMAGFVPVHLERRRTKLDAVLLDDDSLVHLVWKNWASRFEKKLRLYISADALLADTSDLDQSTPIYVDEELGNSISGLTVARQLHEQGFKTVYLATGHLANKFGAQPWLSGIVGKEPPLDCSRT